MKSKPAYTVAIILFLLVNTCLITLVNSQGTTETFTVALNTPADNSSTGTFSNNFTYTPTLIGNDSYYNATLVINGAKTSATNPTAIQNATSNRIEYTFTANGTYQWNILVYDNNTHSATATANFTLTVTVLPAATPTPAPTATPEATPTPTATPTAAPTASPTPEPTPTETPIPTAEPVTIDGSTVLVIGLIVLAVVFALVIVFLWRASR